MESILLSTVTQIPALCFLNEMADNLVPLTAIAMPFVFVLGILTITQVKNYKSRKLQNETIRMFVDKGQPVPNELLTNPDRPKDPNEGRKAGLINIGVGAGLYLLFSHLQNIPEGLQWVGLIPGLIGLAILVDWVLERAEKKRDAGIRQD